jgi:adenosylcobinamide kinase / adenosylcobinamide-phosphate guanylyltransferase
VGASDLTLITGGASSGKSSYACRRAAEHGSRVLYVATCEPRDEEMRAKIERHRKERPATWTTVERAARVDGALRPGYDAAIIDCLTLLIAQQLVGGADEPAIYEEVCWIGAVRPGYPVYVVSNEVGQGVVPESPLARRFAVIQGRANQQLAAAADAVVCMIAGMPLVLKDRKPRA